MKQFSFPAALLLGTSVVAVQAQTNPDTLLVTATRTAQTADQALAAVSVIDRATIERSQAQTVTDLLAQTPGVVITNNGGRGKATSVALRGTSSKQVLVLVDGIKVGSATLGTTAFEHLSVNQIERIEVVRGPRSSLYGSEAIGGVIQIFTRKGPTEQPFRVSAGAGSDDSREVTLGASWGSARGWYNLNVSDYRTDGFNAKTPGSYGYHEDKDGYDNRSYALSGGYRFTDRIEARLNWSQNRGENQYDGGNSYDDYRSKSRLQTLGGALELKPSDSWFLELRAGQSQDRSTVYGDGAYDSHIDTTRDLVSLQSEHFFSRSQLTWGVDYEHDDISSSQSYAVTERDNLGVFGLYQLFLGRHDLAVSLRRDDDEQFGGKTTGSIAWGVELPRNLRLTASYGTAFKAPTFNELYWPDQGWYKGNPNLVPEQSSAYEVGLSGEHAGINWAANVYQNDIDHLIAYDSTISSPNNVDQARIRGLELIASTRIAGWELGSSLDLMDPRDREDDSLLNRRPRKAFTLSADRDFGAFALGGTLQAVGKRKDGSDWLSGYTTVDLRGSYALGRDWSLKAKVENLLDEDYQTAKDYNQPDRTYWVSLHYAP
ncbi:TonB-dependent vitamin B12 receptor [Marinobacterium sp. AK62]|uniref:TonB-dependent vitamin B12 receptor n=1 Tax=Marinobacterium alkalitolerans TaxID=1542925 RepID=A0ABS3Z6G8_9GAMM|nr:TonB-dependent vitamin B12 receptor [Marinobacterium alkalitolerans]MBP0047288.1 TonB-dependent vitamin B12 receptor [Marinobacterium alkalitolerans]